MLFNLYRASWAPESENSGGHIVVDPTRQFIFQLSKKYASPSGIVDVNEIRTWDTDSEGNSFEVVRNEMSNISVPILPQEKYWWRSVPLLVLSLDQGPIGTAGMAFALEGHRIHVKFDKIHRCIRDYKLALGRAMGGVFLKTQLHSSYIFGLNYKPFNSGLFHDQKKNMLEAFLESHNISSDLWQEFRERIAFDFGQTNVVNDRLLFEAITELESFKNKGTLIKPSRWFSWNQCCEEFLPEFHTLKMLAKYEFQDNVRPLDEAEEPPEGMTSIVLGKKTQPESKQRVREDENILRTMEKMKKTGPTSRIEHVEETLWRFQIGIQIDDRGIVRQLQTVGVYHAAAVGLVYSSNQSLQIASRCFEIFSRNDFCMDERQACTRNNCFDGSTAKFSLVSASWNCSCGKGGL